MTIAKSVLDMKLRHPFSTRAMLIVALATVIAVTLFARPRPAAAAADGDLDASFGSGGKIVSDFFGRSNNANAIALQSDGKIVVAGHALSASGPPDFALARYHSDGSLDTSFGSGGRVTTDFAGRSDNAAAVAIQPDGKILAAGGADLGADPGPVPGNGQFNFALARYNPDGSLDVSFGAGGKVTTDFNGGLDQASAIALQADNKIVLAGFATAGDPHMGLVRYNPNGTLDSSFGTAGRVITNINGTRDFANALAIQIDGRIIAAGSTQTSISSMVMFALARYNSDGSLDQGFGSGGKVITQVVPGGDAEDDEIFALAIQPDGRIIAAGEANFAQDFGMVRYLANGSLDNSFGTNGVVTTDFNGHLDNVRGIGIQVDGKIVLAGAANLTTGSTGDFGIARYQPNGALDSTFGTSGRVITDFNSNVDGVRGVVIQSDNKIVAAGSTQTLGNGDFALTRYLASAQPSDVSGRTLDSSGNPLEGVTIRMTGTQDRLTVTDSQGNYRFDNVPLNASGTVSASRANFTFSPMLRSFVHSGLHTEASFSASFSDGGLNPLDTTEYFVRQHYVDFLGREPDEAGFNFWVNQVEACGSDANCREVGRISVSASFFLSIEFQQTGYLVYRTYKAAYGNIPGTPVPLRLEEFLADTRQLGQGVVVGQTGWETTLENNKRVFMEGFVRRTRFLTAYPPGTSAGQYVDALNANAGGVLSATERNQLVNDLIAETKTAGEVLRAVAENQDLRTNEFNRAFVLMEYFGYLRRNPNDSPEATLDFQGYNFWLNKLIQFNGNFINAEMVKAFITAPEYRGRFPR
jgi:uncharacterized delta-60 repeat protein